MEESGNPVEQDGQGNDQLTRPEDERRESVEHARTPGAAAALWLAMRNDFARYRRDTANRWRQRRAERAATAAPRQQRLPRRRKSVWWRAARGAAALLLIALFVGAAVLAWALSDVPWQKIASTAQKPVIMLTDAGGEPIGGQNALQEPYVELSGFPQTLIDAVIAAEDRHFYEHIGIDPPAIVRAALRNFSAGRIVQGGSTITQQLIKIQYLDSDRTIKRKIQEAVIAIWIEHKLGKDEILARYLNNVYLGAGATGMPAAARVYFDKDVADLTLGESAMLAGLIRAPSVLNPLQHFDAARERAGVVLDAMVADGRLNAQSAAVAKADYERLDPINPAIRSGSWFADWIMPDARAIAGPYRGTIRIETTLEPRLQAAAEKVVEQALATDGSTAGAGQAALVAMRPDGAVVAMVGGRDYEDSQYNRAVTARRQPGSAFKLFTYYAALKSGLTPDDEIMDEPIEIDGWSPENYGGDYAGRVSLAYAFAHSLNAATVALADQIGIDKVVAAARELGIDADLDATPSLALGTSGVSLLDLTGAYASVRAGVAPIEPWGIVSFHADDQSRAFSVGPAKAPTTDLSAYQRQLVHLLKLVVDEGTGRAAALNGFAAGKTGTSQNFRDAWFVGFNDDLVVGVWVGNDDETPMDKVTGGKLPARIWHDFMVAALGQKPAPAQPTEPDQSVRPDQSLLPAESVGSEAMGPVSQAPIVAPPPDNSTVKQVPQEGQVAPVAVEQPQQQEVVQEAQPPEPSDVVSSTTAEPQPLTGEEQMAPASCNYRVCSQFYRSFRASDCTYQPYSGPRRICTR